MTDRDRFVNCVLGEKVDRPPYWVFWGPWGTTWHRWVREGMPKEFTSWTDVRRFFGSDEPPHTLPVNFGPCPRVEWRTLEETADWTITVDHWGIKRRNFKGRESMPEFIEFPIKTRRDWEQYKEERLNPDDPRRLDGNWLKLAKEWEAHGWPVQLGDFPDVGCFGTLRWLLGDEECLLAFCEDPGLVHEIMDHMTSIWVTVFEKALKHVRPAFTEFWEDMCGRQGPLISPKHFDEFMAPNYRRMTKVLKRAGVPVIGVDTDGRPDLLLPGMAAAGVNYQFPLEVAAGCDVNEFQRKFPSFAFMGGIDKRELVKGPAAIDRELARIEPAVRRGRYIPTLDHTVPDDVSWENYCYYEKRLKELLGA